MGENVEHHVEEEEKEMFPKIQQLFSNQELDQMGQELEAAKKGARQETVSSCQHKMKDESSKKGEFMPSGIGLIP